MFLKFFCRKNAAYLPDKGSLFRRRVEARKKRFRKKTLPGIHMVGDWGADIGLGESFRSLTRAMQKIGLPVAHTGIVITPEQRTAHDLKPDIEPSECDFALVHLNGDHTFDLGIKQAEGSFLDQKKVIAYWYWELPRLPEQWLNKFPYIDELWVATKYVQDNMARVSTVPVVRVPLPIHIPQAHPDRALFGLPADRFVFSFIFDPTSSVARKNPFAVIEAFKRAFRDTPEPPLLVLKTHHFHRVHGREALARELGEALDSVGGILINEDWNRQKVYDFLASCDAFVSLHRAEGFGLGIAEAMALGKPVVATGYSGNTDFMTPDNSYAVGFRFREVTLEDHRFQPGFEEVYEPGQVWAEPDMDHAALLMRQIFENPGRARETGKRAAQWIASEFNDDKVSLIIKQRLEYLAKAS